MKTKSAKVLPKTAAEISNGGLYRQLVRCGKITCHCASGSLHEGYYYFIRRVGGRLRKTYVPKNRVAELSDLVKHAKEEQIIERRTRLRDRELLAGLRSRLREHDSIIKTLGEAIRLNG